MKCSGVEDDLVQNVKVTCKHGCRLPIPLKELETHEQACDPSTTPTARHSMHDITIGMILETPLDDPLTPDEMVLCTHLVKRGMGGGTQLVLKTGGQVRERVRRGGAWTEENKIHVSTLQNYKHSLY